MKKDELLFYNEYERFYRMASESDAFSAFCRDAFGDDLSQDGFSDIKQTDRILGFIPAGADVHVLDIGCGNGKMLRYLAKKKDISIHGFDFSEQAIEYARSHGEGDFQTGIIGEKEYPDESFDVITAMDTVYFADDMTKLIGQIKRWLKTGGVFFAGYQEGDVIPRTSGASESLIAKAFDACHMHYKVTDISRETYEMLRHKRECAGKYRDMFITEGNEEWYDMLMWQTQCAEESFEKFYENMARYIFTAVK